MGTGSRSVFVFLMRFSCARRKTKWPVYGQWKGDRKSPSQARPAGRSLISSCATTNKTFTSLVSRLHALLTFPLTRFTIDISDLVNHYFILPKQTKKTILQCLLRWRTSSISLLARSYLFWKMLGASDYSIQHLSDIRAGENSGVHCISPHYSDEESLACI